MTNISGSLRVSIGAQYHSYTARRDVEPPRASFARAIFAAQYFRRTPITLP
jgi:hypothetical protein